MLHYYNPVLNKSLDNIRIIYWQCWHCNLRRVMVTEGNNWAGYFYYQLGDKDKRIIEPECIDKCV